MRAAGGDAPPRVLLLAPPTSYRVAAYRLAAASLGIDLVIASEGSHALIPHGSGGLRVDLNDPRATVARVLVAACQGSFSGVVATDDSTVVMASHVAAALKLPHNPPAAARLCRRKDLARECLKDAGLPVPRFRRIDLRHDPVGQMGDVGFPCVVKPLALAGSRGVIRADDGAGLTAACRRVQRIVRDLSDTEERRFVLAEDYLPGKELAVEGLLQDGVLRVLAIFDKPDPLCGPFFEESYYVTPSRASARALAAARSQVAKACTAYGLCHGPVHAEVRVCDGRAWVIEMAARTIGGDCARLLRFGTGRGLEELVLANAVGAAPAAHELEGAAGVLMIPIKKGGCLRRVEGVQRARGVPHVDDVVIAVREGYELVPLPEGGSYLGFIFASGPTPACVEEALRAAHACLDVVVAPVWRLQPTSSRRAP